MAAPEIPRPGPMLSGCPSAPGALLNANIDRGFCGLDGTAGAFELPPAVTSGLPRTPFFLVFIRLLATRCCVTRTFSRTAPTARETVWTPRSTALRTITAGVTTRPTRTPLATSLFVATLATAAVLIAYTGLWKSLAE